MAGIDENSEYRLLKPKLADFALRESELATLRREEEYRKEVDARIGKKYLVLFSLVVAGATFLGYAFGTETESKWIPVLTYLGFICGVVLGTLILGLDPFPRPKVAEPFLRLQKYESALKSFRYWQVRREREHWENLDGREFEVELAKLLRAFGHQAKTTSASGDGGIDIEVRINGERIIVQCKATKKPVGTGAVRDLIGTRTMAMVFKAILASTSGFSSHAKKLSIEGGLYLWDVDSILNMEQELEKLCSNRIDDAED